MKKIKFLLVATLIMMVVTCQTAFAAESAVNIIINGKTVAFTEDSGYPYVDENSRTMVPLRVTMESAGCAVGFDGSASTAIVVSEHDRVEVPIGTDYLYNNNIVIQNDTLSVVSNGRTYLPIRAVLESLGYTVEWDSTTNSVIAYNFTLDDTFIPYSTTNLETLVAKILSGDVVIIDGGYYATPDYVKQITNTVVEYVGDDLNTAIYPQDSRYDLIDFDFSSANWE